MLDNNYGISTVTKSAKNIHQTMNIGEMKSGRRFIQNVPSVSSSRRQPKHNNPVGLAFFCGKNYIFAHRICELLRR